MKIEVKRDVKIAYLSFCLIACVIAIPAAAHAEQADAPNVAGSDDMPWNRGIGQDTRIAAREAFLEGNRLFKIPLFSRAAEKYLEAIDKWKHPAFYFNLAIAEINLGQYLEARDSLERALKYGADPLRADRFQEAKKQLVDVEHHLARIRVDCQTPGAEVTLDGATLFTGPGKREVWVTVHAHEIAAKRSQYATAAKRVAVAAGGEETVSLSLRKLVEDRPWSTWKPWVVVGAGVAVAGAAGVLQALSSRDFNNYDSRFGKLACSAMGCTEQQIAQDDPTLTKLLDHARLEKRLAIGGYIAGGAAIAAGAVLVYLNRPHLLTEDVNQNAAGIAVVPVVSPDTIGIQVMVRQ